MKHTLAQQLEFSPSKHHALDEFELIHFSLDHAVALGNGESCQNCCLVSLNSHHKTL